MYHLQYHSLKRTESPPHNEHQQGQTYRNHEVQINQICHLRAVVVGRKVPECSTEEGCDEGSGQENESDRRDESHVGAVPVVELVVSRGEDIKSV